MVLKSVETSTREEIDKVNDSEMATIDKNTMKKNAATWSLSTKAGKWQKSGKRRLCERGSSVQLLISKLLPSQSYVPQGVERQSDQTSVVHHPQVHL